MTPRCNVALGEPKDRKFKMIRTLAAVCLVVCLSGSLEASEVCVACQGPAATYRCSLDRSTIDSRIKLGEFADQKVCEKVLSRLGPHGTCKMVELQPCNGKTRSVTLAEYQRALTDNNEQTYQPSVLEKAQSGMSKTWGCVSSLFKNC
jgi:hypothetical protein